MPTLIASDELQDIVAVSAARAEAVGRMVVIGIAEGDAADHVPILSQTEVRPDEARMPRQGPLRRRRNAMRVSGQQE